MKPTTSEGLIYEHFKKLTNPQVAFTVSQLQETLFIKKLAFSFEDYFIMGADEELYIVVNPTNLKGSSVFLNPIVAYSTAGPITMDFYLGTKASNDGTLLESSNRRINGKAAKLILRQNPTITDIGSRISGDLVPSTGTAPATSSGAANVTALPFEISKKYKLTVKFVNKNGANVYLQIKETWFEV